MTGPELGSITVSSETPVSTSESTMLGIRWKFPRGSVRGDSGTGSSGCVMGIGCVSVVLAAAAEEEEDVDVDGWVRMWM